MLYNLSSISYVLWLGAALLLGIIDVLFGANFFLLWLACCSLVVALTTYLYPELSLLMQLGIFIFAAMIVLSCWIDYIKKNKPNNSSTLNRRAEQLIGRKAPLIEPVVNNSSKIKLDDAFWRVTFINTTHNLMIGDTIEVIAVDDLTLIAQPQHA